MRTYTLAFSILAHAVVVSVALIATLLATGELPEPRRSSTFIEVRPVTIAVPDVRRRAVRHADQPPTTAAQVVAVPLTPPDTIANSFFDVPVENGISSIPAGIVGDDPSAGAPLPPPVRTTSPPVRVGSVVRAPTKVTHVAPVYPTFARSARVEGTVILEAVIAESGAVQDVRVLRSVPLLDAAAIDAVRQWRFTPTMLNGEVIPVVMTVTVTFTLQR